MTCCFAIFEELAHYIVQFKYKQIPWNQHSYFSYLKEDIKDLSAMIRILCLLIAALALSVECKPEPCSSGRCGRGGQYGCYCMDLSFHDYFGNEHGNCLSSDPSGFRWCYVSAWSSCYHKQRSQR